MDSLLVAFVTGKGGAGKSTITQIVATTMNKYTDKKVCIIDVDIQRSIYNLRKREEKQFTTDHSLLKELKELNQNGKGLVDVYEADPTDLEFIAKTMKKYDLTFLDMPGSLAVPGVKELYFFLDFAFIPYYINEFSYESHNESLKLLMQIKSHEKSRMKEFGVFFNKYSQTKNHSIFCDLEKVFVENKITILKPIYENVEYERKYRSTIKSVPYSPSEKNVHVFIDSLIKTIYNNHNN